jgi:hypothetical protein
MRKRLAILCFFCMAFSLQLSAQISRAGATHFSSLFKHHSLLYFSHNPGITQTQPIQRSFASGQQVYSKKIKPPSINDMPFFCALECRLRGQTGLWIKFRTGDDASYEKLIRSVRK